MNKRTRPGPTSKFPDGKLSREDRGEVTIAIRDNEGVIVIDFGTELSWMGMLLEQAKEFGEALIARANKVIALRLI